MRSFINHPTIYSVLGIGACALLFSAVSQSDESTTDFQREFDPFSNLAELEEQTLDITTNPVIDAGQTPAARADERWTELPATASAAPSFPAMPMIEDDFAPLELDDDIEMETAQLETASKTSQTPDGSSEVDLATASRYELELESVDAESVLPQRVTTDVSDTSSIQVNTFGSRSSQTPPAGLSSQPKRFQWKNNPFIDADQMPAVQPSQDVDDSPTLAQNASIDAVPELASILLQTSDQRNEVQSGVVDTPASPIAASFESTNRRNQIAPVIDASTTEMQSVVTQASLPIVVGLPESVSHKAVHSIEYGKSLSRRGAAFAARQEFYSALRMMAQSHDASAGGNAYTQSLRSGILALKEAEDFIVSDTETQIGLNVADVIEGHSTNIIGKQEARTMTAIEAMQRYFFAASHQIRTASGSNVVAAEALYCLGKLHTVQARFSATPSKLDIAKAIVFHQAAMAADSNNYRSANELGALLANSGRLDESQDMLKRSLRISQMPQTWQNLAVVHQRRGEQQLAQMAQREAAIAASQANHPGYSQSIRWVDSATFNDSTPVHLQQHVAETQGVPQPAPQGDNRSFGQRLKSLF